MDYHCFVPNNTAADLETFGGVPLGAFHSAGQGTVFKDH